jgi:hypothetical protein
MKKLAAVMLVAVLACSFLVGAFVADTQAREANCPNTKITKQCEKLKYLACNLDDCRLYEIWFCPYGVLEIWTGEYCPAYSGCW